MTTKTILEQFARALQAKASSLYGARPGTSGLRICVRDLDEQSCSILAMIDGHECGVMDQAGSGANLPCLLKSGSCASSIPLTQCLAADTIEDRNGASLPATDPANCCASLIEMYWSAKRAYINIHGLLDHQDRRLMARVKMTLAPEQMVETIWPEFSRAIHADPRHLSLVHCFDCPGCDLFGESPEFGLIDESIRDPNAFLRVMGFEGFALVLCDSTKTRHGQELLTVMWRQSDGIMLVFDSFCHQVSSIHLLFQWMPRDGHVGHIPPGCSSMRLREDPPIFAAIANVSRQMRRTIANLRLEGEFVQHWLPTARFPEIQHQCEDGLADDELQARIRRRIAQFPEAVRAQCGFKLGGD